MINEFPRYIPMPIHKKSICRDFAAFQKWPRPANCATTIQHIRIIFII